MINCFCRASNFQLMTLNEWIGIGRALWATLSLEASGGD